MTTWRAVCDHPIHHLIKALGSHFTLIPTPLLGLLWATYLWFCLVYERRLLLLLIYIFFKPEKVNISSWCDGFLNIASCVGLFRIQMKPFAGCWSYPSEHFLREKLMREWGIARIFLQLKALFLLSKCRRYALHLSYGYSIRRQRWALITFFKKRY